MELRYYIIRRLLLLIPTILGLTVLTFLLMRAFPNYQLVQGYINPHSSIPVSVQMLNAEKALGLNYPPPVQYIYYLKDLFLGNWGQMSTTFYSGPVLRGIEYFFPNTVQLAIFSIILSIIIAIPLGTYIGARPNTAADQAGRVFSLAFYAMPTFWLALILQIILGQDVIYGNPFGIFPIQGSFQPTSINPLHPPSWLINTQLGTVLSSPTHLILFDALIHGDFAVASSAFMSLVLPVVTLTLTLLAGILRFVRAGMVDAASQEYVKTARSKGVPERLVIKRHIRKNALIPTVTVLGLLFASLLGGVVTIEYVFGYPGIGLFGLNAVLQNQIFGVMGTTLIFGLILVMANLIVDVVYALIDPRIRY